MEDKFYKIETRAELADVIGIPLKELTYMLYKLDPNTQYETFEIAKKSGGQRIINSPNFRLKKIQLLLKDAIVKRYTEYAKENHIENRIVHGFVKEKSIYTNAKIHKNKKYVYCVDIKDFFPSFNFNRVRGYFQKNRCFCFSYEAANVVAQLSCLNGTLPQGAPTSPVISNLIFNILDMKIIKLAKEYRLNYTRYADDMTFSTNWNDFKEQVDQFHLELEKLIIDFNFEINEAKTTLEYNNSRQKVTGLTVNKKPNVTKEFYKNTKAMAHSLYLNGTFYIGEKEGTLNQLQGRFSYIEMIERNNYIEINNKKDYDFNELSSKSKEYQKFLFYKNFYHNEKPAIMTEGKTDILYLKAALKKYAKEYPNLVSIEDGTYHYKVDFIKRNKTLKRYFEIDFDGASELTFFMEYYIKNISKSKGHKANYPIYPNYFKNTYHMESSNPLIILYDNELVPDMPLKIAMNNLNKKGYKVEENIVNNNFSFICHNLYLLTNPKINSEEKLSDIETLFKDDVLGHKINEKSFNKDANADRNQFYGKDPLSKFVYRNYENLDLSNFKKLLDDIDLIIQDYKTKVAK